MNKTTDDYDSPWKEALTRYFPEFLDFYFPLAKLLYERDWGKQQVIDLFAVIDWLMTLPPELEKNSGLRLVN